MELFGGALSVTGVSFLVLSIFAIAIVGYLLGRITVKGVNLGTAGVFIIALVFGCLLYPHLEAQLSSGGVSYVGNALKIIENMGLILFVTSVGFIAGPKFFGNLKRNFKSYILLGLVIIASGTLACIICLLIARGSTDLTNEELSAIMTGLMAGALTSTPAFSASKEAVGEALEPLVSTGYAIAYLFGVIGVVLFVQLIPKILKADMAKERAAIAEIASKTDIPVTGTETKKKPSLINIDDFGIAAFALAAALGLVVGSIKFGNFSLTSTGGCLLASLVLGHFGRIGRLNFTPDIRTLKVFREFGLVLFLIGAGVAGGAKFIEFFEPVYFLYGVVMTLLPMIIGFIFARLILKIKLLNALGSITGGMTSTPALGTLIHVSGTEDVAAAYAATYPIALISVVLASQLVIIIF
ncbi:MAG: permease [Clostridia bacterium]|nr:permease [Clostridia bacterium]MBR2370394.1 permease [Clostridia bacterium]